MPRVSISGSACQQFTGGAREIDVEADTFRRLVLELDRRYPGLGRLVEESMAIAIDGEIYQDAYHAPLRPESEILADPEDRRRVTDPAIVAPRSRADRYRRSTTAAAISMRAMPTAFAGSSFSP